MFTASHSCYANPVIDYLDPEGTYISKRLFRDNCVQIAEGFYVKDLRIFRNRDLKNVVLVDNAAYSYALQLDNGIPIIPFYKRKDDTELLDLIGFIKGMLEVEDVRDYVGEAFCYEAIVDHGGNLPKLFSEMFDM